MHLIVGMRSCLERLIFLLCSSFNRLLASPMKLVADLTVFIPGIEDIKSLIVIRGKIIGQFISMAHAEFRKLFEDLFRYGINTF